MKIEIWKLSIPVMITLIAMLTPLIAADSDNINATATVGDVTPYISQMNLSTSSYDPTENSTTTVISTIRVYDGNGVADIDNTKCKCEVDDASTFSAPVAKYTNTSCIVIGNIDAYTREYQCSWNMDFYDSAIEYSTKMYGGDTATTVSNDTAGGSPDYNYTELIASYLDTTSITWTNPTLNTANVSSNSDVTIYNSGNVALDANITGANLTSSGKPDLNVIWFSVGTIDDATDEIQLTTLAQIITNAGIAQGSSGTPNPSDILYWFFDTPTVIQPATYSGQWVLGEFKST